MDLNHARTNGQQMEGRTDVWTGEGHGRADGQTDRFSGRADGRNDGRETDQRMEAWMCGRRLRLWSFIGARCLRARGSGP